MVERLVVVEHHQGEIAQTLAWELLVLLAEEIVVVPGDVEAVATKDEGQFSRSPMPPPNTHSPLSVCAVCFACSKVQKTKHYTLPVAATSTREEADDAPSDMGESLMIFGDLANSPECGKMSTHSLCEVCMIHARACVGIAQFVSPLQCETHAMVSMVTRLCARSSLGTIGCRWVTRHKSQQRCTQY